MAFKPSSTELAKLIDVAALAEWAGFSATAPAPAPLATGSPPVSPVQAFCGFVGCGPTDHFHCLAVITPAAWAALMASFTINGSPPTIKETGSAILFNQAARCLSHLEMWPEDAAAAAAAAAIPPPAGLASGHASAGPKLLNTPVISVSKVFDQKASEEITYLPGPEIQACHARYVAIMEEMPSPALDVTTEQLACLDFLLTKTAKPPYADFSIFG